MKVIQRGIMKILPGKMAQAMELMKKHNALATHFGTEKVPKFVLGKRFGRP